MEDGFAAYAASKAALNMAVRHMAAELKRKDDDTILLCMHPGEVATDMANIQLPWEVQGVITPEESVSKMIEVIKSKGIQHSGTFWTWENKVSRTLTCVLRASTHERTAVYVVTDPLHCIYYYPHTSRNPALG